jgi:tRNA (mo5U34)-methyltransferase
MSSALASNSSSQTTKSIPPAPPGFNAQEFFKGIFWYQQWELFEGIITPGIGNNVHALFDQLLHVPKDLSGKRVLDIGAWNGCASFECERRGASEVIALGPENPANTGFNKIRDALGLTRTRYLQGTVYDLDPEKLGHFDLVLFLGVLYHLRYPLLGIDNIRRVCTGTVFVETFVTDNAWICKEQGEIKKCPQNSISPKLESHPVWQFYRSDELDGDNSNWFGPNSTAVLQAFKSAGFDVELVSSWNYRAGFRAQVKDGLPEFLACSLFDRRFYDVLLSPVLGKRKLLWGGQDGSWRVTVLASDEYFAKAGGTNRKWIAALYQDLLAREAYPEESSRILVSVQQSGEGERQRIVAAILASAEYVQKRVVAFYSKFMKRIPSALEITGWTHRMGEGSSEEEVIQAFVASHEYFCQSGLSNRGWLNRIHLDLLVRSPDPKSQICVEALDKGIDSRSVVATNIVASSEYRRLCLAQFLSRKSPAETVAKCA